MWLTVIGGLQLAVAAVGIVVDPAYVPAWIIATSGLSVAGAGIAMLVRSRRDLAAFEAEHGEGAGVQDPVR